jgi:hypothetical protein
MFDVVDAVIFDRRIARHCVVQKTSKSGFEMK